MGPGTKIEENDCKGYSCRAGPWGPGAFKVGPWGPWGQVPMTRRTIARAIRFGIGPWGPGALGVGPWGPWGGALGPMGPSGRDQEEDCKGYSFWDWALGPWGPQVGALGPRGPRRKEERCKVFEPS